MQSLAIKYRPKTWEDVTEQGAVKVILQQQLGTNTIRHAYLFCGGAGTGKTTCARIFANEINKGQGNPIEMDAASNNSVDDVREIIQQAKTRSLDSEYKVFIIDECHSLSNTAWQAMLKLIEEPPAKSIFIFATTDPQKIPKTILSRVQRYDFQRISQQGIVDRLDKIILAEYGDEDSAKDISAMEYIAKIADGGMRDAITMMDKCLAYSTDLTLENVVKALGVADYNTMQDLTTSILAKVESDIIPIIENIHSQGKDLKQFVKSYMQFVLDLCKWDITGTFDYTTIPATEEYKKWLKTFTDNNWTDCRHLLSTLINLNADIRWDTSPKAMIEATLLMEVLG